MIFYIQFLPTITSFSKLFIVLKSMSSNSMFGISIAEVHSLNSDSSVSFNWNLFVPFKYLGLDK